jgi:leucyl/phenylalanyl-tRNA--protein transferase
MIYQLHREDTIFPPAEHADEGGIIAFGGDLGSERLIRAYESGIFPWPHEGLPLLWFSPDPRAVLYPDRMHVSRSLRRSIKRYEIRFDSDFEGVINGCAARPATWLRRDMIDAYIGLHEMGRAHSVEAYCEGKLAGGLYGVEVGNIFCGESMYSARPDASKAALYALCERLAPIGGLVDCQVMNPHLASLGAREIPRRTFLKILAEARGRAKIF